jgi:hypothetical protein
MRIVYGVANGLRLYSRILIEAKSPGEIIWEIFGDLKGRRPVFSRDLICDWQTLSSMPRTGRSTDEKTMAFEPFVPQFKLNGEEWNRRRAVLRRAFEPQFVARVLGPYPAPSLGEGLLDLYVRIFEACFEAGFKYIFGRAASETDRAKLLPGLHDLNCYVKRQVFSINPSVRRLLYDSILSLTSDPSSSGFIFAGREEFYALQEMDRASAIASDLLFSCCVQPADLVSHMLVLRSQFPREFDSSSLDHCMNEALRLFPLSDIYARVPHNGDRAWLASLVQLNSNGWAEPNRFFPQRWESASHPSNMAWGVEARRCPAADVGLAITKGVFSAIAGCTDIQLTFASDFKHERTFPYGLPTLVTHGGVPRSFQMPGKTRRLMMRWIIERKRMIEQGEIW